MTRPPFSCSCPVMLLLFAAAASNKARKYGMIGAPACIFPCCLQGTVSATFDLMGPGSATAHSPDEQSEIRGPHIASLMRATGFPRECAATAVRPQRTTLPAAPL